MYLTRHNTPDGSLGSQRTLSACRPPSRRCSLARIHVAGAAVRSGGLGGPPPRALCSRRSSMAQKCGAAALPTCAAATRKAESATADVYQKVYEAERRKSFFKAPARIRAGRTRAHPQRRAGTCPSLELTLVINTHNEIVGYTVGNDMSSRDIEGQNLLYLPQAKTYDGSCALGPGIRIMQPEEMADLMIGLQIKREGSTVFEGETSTAQMKRSFTGSAGYLCRELSFPQGAYLMTGTGRAAG